MKEKDEIKTTRIYRGAIWEAQMVKNLLENAGIESFLQDEIIGTLHLPWESSGGVGMVMVIIAETDYDQARIIVEEYEQNRKENQE